MVRLRGSGSDGLDSLAATLSRIAASSGDRRAKISLLIWRMDAETEIESERGRPLSSEERPERENLPGAYIEVWEGSLENSEHKLYLRFLGRTSTLLRDEVVMEIDYDSTDRLSVQVPSMVLPEDAGEYRADRSNRQGWVCRSLSKRQGEIASLVCRGLTNKEIADRLFISPKTVEYHLSILFQRFSIASRQELRKIMQG
ncbi:helix-turn-helix transcriptional regulator [Streptomyces sp. NPDC019396]|uniref:helix-turn-helix transcriptional regulator n=1 Tax=Streptomyces sp. NPDC019396 TaxID=3154687 RepID=UPI0033C68F9E